MADWNMSGWIRIVRYSPCPRIPILYACGSLCILITRRAFVCVCGGSACSVLLCSHVAPLCSQSDSWICLYILTLKISAFLSAHTSAYCSCMTPYSYRLLLHLKICWWLFSGCRPDYCLQS